MFLNIERVGRRFRYGYPFYRLTKILGSSNVEAAELLEPFFPFNSLFSVFLFPPYFCRFRMNIEKINLVSFMR